MIVVSNTSFFLSFFFLSFERRSRSFSPVNFLWYLFLFVIQRCFIFFYYKLKRRFQNLNESPSEVIDIIIFFEMGCCTYQNWRNIEHLFLFCYFFPTTNCEFVSFLINMTRIRIIFNCERKSPERIRSEKRKKEKGV